MIKKVVEDKRDLTADEERRFNEFFRKGQIALAEKLLRDQPFTVVGGPRFERCLKILGGK